MNQEKQSITYILQDIECFQHRVDGYPVKIHCLYDGGFSCNEAYTADQFEFGETKIRDSFLQQGKTVDIMNPLYQYDGKLETVITIDIVIPRAKKSDNQTITHSNTPKWFDEVVYLIQKHEERFQEIFTLGGDISMENIRGVHISNDTILRDIEMHMQTLISQKKKIGVLLQMVADGDATATTAMQWVKKDGKIIDSLIGMLEKQGLSPMQQNFLLRQLIPYHELLDKAQRKRIVLLIQSILYHAVPMVRNKALSVASYFSHDDLAILSDKCRLFITEISKTKQLNCSYPAQEILRKLKSLET